jgi:hypothetical protein
MPWNLEELRCHVRTLQFEREHLLDTIRSIDRYDTLFVYHMATARDAMNGLIHEEPGSELKNAKYVFGVAEKQADFNFAKVVSEAHILACVHTVRAMCDVFAQLINALALNSDFTVADCRLIEVTNRLPDCPLKQELDALIASHWFMYVSAFVNTAKHRYLVGHSMHVSFVNGDAGIRLDSFEYNRRRYRDYSATEVLEGVIAVKNAVVNCGMALNARALGRI